MIPFLFPMAEGMDKLKKAPVTIALGVLILFCFCFSFGNYHQTLSSYTKIGQNEEFISSNFYLYTEFLKKRPQHKFHDLVSKISNMSDGKRRQISLMSLQDFEYIESMHTLSLILPEFERLNWKKEMLDFESVKKSSHSMALGFIPGISNLSQKFSYMFFHAGFFHLLINLIFLFAFGSALESHKGGLFVLLVFVGGGWCAASLFELLAAKQIMYSLVGASGAICSLIACYVALYPKRKTVYYYWFLPHTHYMGFIYMRAYWVLVMWLLSDLAGQLASSVWNPGVAHSAHLGGLFMGLAIGLSLRLILKLKPQGLSLRHLSFQSPEPKEVQEKSLYELYSLSQLLDP